MGPPAVPDLYRRLFTSCFGSRFLKLATALLPGYRDTDELEEHANRYRYNCLAASTRYIEGA